MFYTVTPTQAHNVRIMRVRGNTQVFACFGVEGQGAAKANDALRFLNEGLDGVLFFFFNRQFSQKETQKFNHFCPPQCMQW